MHAPSLIGTYKFFPDALPMNGGSDRYRHRNNYEPFFVTISATAKVTYSAITPGNYQSKAVILKTLSQE